MNVHKYTFLKGLLAPLIALGLATGCTTYNPNTGQQQIDYGATAGVAGAAMGAAALGVALSNNDNDRYYGGRPVYVAGGGRGHNNVNVNRNVNVSGNTVNRNNRVNSRGNVAGRRHR